MPNTLTKVKNRMLREAADSLGASKSIVAEIVNSGGDSDIQSIRTAANQARLAAMNLDQLCGLIEAGLLYKRQS